MPACSFHAPSLIQNTYHPILPFCYFAIQVDLNRLNAFIMRKKGVKSNPLTLGEHLRNRRIRLSLRQEDVALRLGTLREVYDRWERDVRKPVISEWPRLLGFLGYYPFQENQESDSILKARRFQGMDQKALASALGVTPQTLREFEHATEIPHARIMIRVAELANMPPLKLLS